MKKIYTNPILILMVIAIVAGLIYLFWENYVSVNISNEVSKNTSLTSSSSSPVIKETSQTNKTIAQEKAKIPNVSNASGSKSDPYAQYTNIFSGKVLNKITWPDGSIIPGTQYNVSVWSTDKGQAPTTIVVNMVGSAPELETNLKYGYVFMATYNDTYHWYDVTPQSIHQIAENAGGAGSQ